MGFADWNHRLLMHFFGAFAEGQLVRLAISEDVLDEEFADLGGSKEFLRVVRAGPDWPVKYDSTYRDWAYPSTLIDRAVGLWSQWMNPWTRHPDYVAQLDDAPSYLPYLCLLCYAWTVELNGVAAHNFFTRLEQAYPRHGLNGAIDQLTCLWDGLAQWTDRLDGRCGTFAVERLGGMDHVGIPKAQVILTARCIERLPHLFSCAGLVPGQVYDIAQFEQSIVNCPGACQDLGQNVRDAIMEGNAIGQSAIQQLWQHFDEWDGAVPHLEAEGHEGQGNGAPRQAVPRAGELVMGLVPSPAEDAQQWQLEAYVSGVNLPGGNIDFDAQGQLCTVQLSDLVSGPVVRQNDARPLEHCHFFEDLEEFDLDAVWRDEHDGERRVLLRYRARPIRVFSWFGPALIQRNGLPAEGDAYVLVHEQSMENWAVWQEELPEAVQVIEDLPQAGLPAGWTLYCVSGLGLLDNEQWQRFPDGGEVGRPRPKVIRLVGGSRARKTGVRRTYLPFDPPQVVVEAEGDITLSAVNATLEEGSMLDPQVPQWARSMNQSTTRRYRVEPHSDAAVVSVSVKRDGAELERVSFGLVRNDVEAGIAAPANFRLDNTGEPASGTDGAIGLCVAQNAPPWPFHDGPCEDGIPLGEYLDEDRPWFQFFQWLAAHGRVSFTRARDLITNLLGQTGARTNPTRETRALLHLGHLELQTDSRGRWAFVHAVPFALYALPLTREGCFQAVAGGTISRDSLRRLVATAAALHVSVDVRGQTGGGTFGYLLAPPRIRLLSNDLEALEYVAQECGAQWLSTPPAWSIAHWSANLQTWIDQIRWRIEAGPPAEATYRPCDFKTRDGDTWPPFGTHKLSRLDDPVTQRHFSYYLVRREREDFRHAPVAQRAWACWHVHNDVMKALAAQVQLNLPSIPVAYEAEHRMLVVPLELELPLLLTRSLVACSGLTPLLLRADQYPAYADPANGFTPHAGYTGPCLGYRHVPQRIADIVLGKVGASTKVFPPLPELRLG
jgi:hypothetical protein